MTFEVYRDNFCVMQTEQPRCIYDDSTLRDMSRSGYKFKLDGKTATIQKVIETRKECLNC